MEAETTHTQTRDYFRVRRHLIGSGLLPTVQLNFKAGPNAIKQGPRRTAARRNSCGVTTVGASAALTSGAWLCRRAADGLRGGAARGFESPVSAAGSRRG